jgi:3-oxoacyl-[acyl-carrier-protein] synthase III
MAGECRSVAALAADGKLESEPELLERFGFGTVHVATAESPYDLAVRAAGDLLSAHAIDPDSVDAIVYGGTPSCMAFAPGREAIYNCTSDAACAVLVDGDGDRNRLGAAVTVTKGYYWDHDALRDQVVASYFPTAKRVIEQTVRAAGWQPGDVDWVIPHNVSRRSWELLLGLTPLPKARLWSANIARYGHTLAGDNFINLHDALTTGAVSPGERLLLFAYGFGAHWTALAVEA